MKEFVVALGPDIIMFDDVARLNEETRFRLRRAYHQPRAQDYLEQVLLPRFVADRRMALWLCIPDFADRDYWGCA